LLNPLNRADAIGGQVDNIAIRGSHSRSKSASAIKPGVSNASIGNKAARRKDRTSGLRGKTGKDARQKDDQERTVREAEGDTPR